MSTIVTLQSTDLITNSRSDINTNFANLNTDKLESANLPSASVDNEVVLFSSTTGKVLKRASTSGIAKLTSGVLSVVTAPSGTIVGTSDSQILTNKTIAGGSNTISGITESMLSTSDLTTLDVSTSKHGFVPKAPNDTTKFLRGDGSWAAPAGSSVKLAVLTSQISLSGSSTETDIIANTNVPAGSLSAGRCILCRAYIGITQANTSGTVSFRVYFGGSAIGTITVSGAAILMNGFVEFSIAYVGASSQYVSGMLNAIPQTTGSNASTTMGSLSTTSAVNEANAQNVKMTIQGSAANTPTTLVVYGATINLI